MTVTLSSQWGGENYGLNKHLIANIYPVNIDGSLEDKNETTHTVIAAPLTEGNFDASFNWQSAFENYGTDAKYSSISQLLQSGQAATMLNLLSSFLPSDNNGIFGDALKEAKALTDKLSAQAKELTGATGITKLNSRQVFSGMPPIKIPITLYFRAWSDPRTEVEEPIDALMSWALPQELASSVAESALADIKSSNFKLASLFPSKIPKFVALEYGGRTYKPLVIESIGHPLVLPRSKNGEMLSVSVQLTLATLSAWDTSDYLKTIMRPIIPVSYAGTITDAS